MLDYEEIETRLCSQLLTRMLEEAREKGRAEEREACAKLASDFSMRPDRRLHPDVAWSEMNDLAHSVAHATAQTIAEEIRARAARDLRVDAATLD